MLITTLHNMCLAQPDTYNQDQEGAQQVSTSRPLQNPCCLLPRCTVQFTVCRTVGRSAAPPPPLGSFCFCWRWDTGSYRHYDFMTFLCSYNTTCATSSAPSHPTQPHTHTPPVCCYGWPCTSTPRCHGTGEQCPRKATQPLERKLEIYHLQPAM